jgi:two-component system, OmpR family, copper resistance phosphate regulon response regulator CusR
VFLTPLSDKYQKIFSRQVLASSNNLRGKKSVRILVIEDEQKLAKALQEGLEAEEYGVAIAPTGEEGFYCVETESFDLVILDAMLPRRNGFEILTTMRQHGFRTPVLMLTALDQIEDRVRGLDAGADDYLVKPFAFPELLARIRALSRRGMPETGPKLRMCDLEIDAVGRTVTRGGQPLDLTAREFDLLEYLVRHQGHVVSREMLTREVWKEPGRHTPLDNVIDVHVARLRRKIDDPFDRKLLHTVRGVGFVMRERELNQRL